MNDITDTPPGRGGPRRTRLLYTGGLLAAGTLAGGILAGTLSASAAQASSSTASTSSTASSTSVSAAATAATVAATVPGRPGSAGANGSGPPPAGVGGSTPVRSDEKSLSAADAALAKAAALKAVPGGTVYRVETDAGDGTYEAHMHRADGTLVTVKLNASFAVTKVESGMGQGDPTQATSMP